MSGINRPAVPINLKEVLQESAATSTKQGISFWKMLLYFIIFFLLLNLAQLAADTYKKKRLLKGLVQLRIGDHIMINSTIQGKVQKIDNKEIYLVVDDGGTLIPVKKEVIINLKILR